MFMLKAKIYLTIFTLYEIVAVLLLHFPRTCDAMFGAAFCNDHVLKYFIWCFAVPALVFLLAMWINEIFVARPSSFADVQNQNRNQRHGVQFQRPCR